MTTHLSADQTLRFQIEPQLGESARACSAITRSVLPTARGNVLLFALYGAVGAASYFLTPDTRFTTFIISICGVMGTIFGFQAIGRANMRRLRLADSHSMETHFVEISSAGVHTWCSHVDAHYPWTDFAKVVESKDFYMAVRPNGAGAAIPKRLLSKAEDSQLRERLRDWSPDRGANLGSECGA